MCRACIDHLEGCPHCDTTVAGGVDDHVLWHTLQPLLRPPPSRPDHWQTATATLVEWLQQHNLPTLSPPQKAQLDGHLRQVALHLPPDDLISNIARILPVEDHQATALKHEIRKHHQRLMSSRILSLRGAPELHLGHHVPQS